jgi:hypothetical protein
MLRIVQIRRIKLIAMLVPAEEDGIGEMERKNRSRASTTSRLSDIPTFDQRTWRGQTGGILMREDLHGNFLMNFNYFA